MLLDSVFDVDHESDIIFVQNMQVNNGNRKIRDIWAYVSRHLNDSIAHSCSTTY
jgi:hypothetical protein